MWPLIPWSTTADLATVGISYTNLGKETAEMAVEILEGGDPRHHPGTHPF